MFVPIVKPGMKQARQFSRLRVEAGKIRTFVKIAVMAGEREILRRILSIVLARGMFDVKRKRLLLLPQSAILTATCRA